MALAVGIDLGTTNTVVAVVKDGVAQTITDAQGHKLVPSVVAFHPSGSVLVGRGALERRLNDAPNTIYSVKRLIGRTWDSPEVQDARGKLPFELAEGPNGATQVRTRGNAYSLPEISAFVLRQVKAIAEAALGEPVVRSVITVPANFNDLQRATTKVAGRLAGLDVLRILNEPTAAALAYGPATKPRERVAVYDLGGGTFDITILDLSENVFEVLATAGDTALGGDDIDVIVAGRMAEDLLKKHRFDAAANPAAFGRLRILAEELKRTLSTRDVSTIEADDLVPADRGAALKWSFRMTRAELEWSSLALVERTFRVCNNALEAAGTPPSELERVILVGGAARMPMVARKVEQFFGKVPIVRINPDEVVALGAAIQASLLGRDKTQTKETAFHPRIAEASIIEAIPVEEAPPSIELDLPVVEGANAPSLPLVGATKGARPAMPGLVQSAGLPLVGAPVEAVKPAPAAASKTTTLPGVPAPKAMDFLPGGAGRRLVFDPPEPDIGAGDSSLVDLASAWPSVPPGAARSTPPAAPAAHVEGPAPVPALAPAPAPAPLPPPRRAPLLIDVTPHSLGVETAGGFCDVLIEANTPVPCDRSRAFATARDNQTTVTVRVSQGESKRFAENTCLGEVELSGIKAAPRGTTKIAVTFEIDADGILHVKARDGDTGHETTAHLQLLGAQSEPADLEAMRARQDAHPLVPLPR